MVESNIIGGRVGICSHLYGFNKSLNWVPPFCGIAERVLRHSSLSPAVLIDPTQNGELVRVMEVDQAEYAISILGEVQAFRGTCLEICGKCPFRMPALEKGKRPVTQDYRAFDPKQRTSLTVNYGIDPLVIQAIEKEASFNGSPVICKPEFAVITVPSLALGEVRVGRRYKESFLGVLSRTLKSPLVDLLLYHPSYINGRASLAHFEVAKTIDVL